MNRKGFTLVEILIVVIILGILAAIVIPQFTEASNDARESALASDLQTLRSQLELYRVQHLDTYPGANMVTELTSKTQQDGTVDAAGNLGPYLQKFPTNDFVTNGNTVTTGTDAAGTAGATGWMYNTATGQVWPGDAKHAGL